MHRSFEELGAVVDGIAYGHFTGEAQFDETGSVVVIDIEGSSFDGPTLTLGIDDLVRERINLRRRYGVDFESAGGAAARAHVIKFTLFQSLSVALELRYRDDIQDYLVDVREGRAADAA